MSSAPRRGAFLWPAALLFLFNAALVGPLFVTERASDKGSIEGAFIGLARFFSHHPNPFGWHPYWYGGAPAQYTYTPGLHYINALAMRLLGGLKPGQVYHAVTAVFYCLGAVTMAYMVYFFTRERWWALGAGMLYSLWSPAQWLIREVRVASVGFEAPWRLQVLVRWGEGPHIASLALLPLAVCALWKAANQKRGFSQTFLAAVLLAAVVLINWIGAFALGAVFVCLMLTLWSRRAALRALAAAGLAYLLAVFWISPSFIRTIAFNAQTVGGHYEYHLDMVWLLGGAAAGLVFLRLAFRAFPPQPYLGFLVLNTFFFGYLTLSSFWFHRYMIPQPERYVPEFELFLILLWCEIFRLGLRQSAGRRRQVVGLAMVALAVLAVGQSRRYLRRSHRMLRPARAEEWVEYKIASWLNDHVSRNDRVFILGSEGMSLNGWFDVAQAKGWFDPGVRHAVVLEFTYQISSSMNAPRGREGAIAVELLKSLGARYVVVKTPNSSLAYHDFVQPDKFEGLLPAVYRPTPEEAIYEVPGVLLAHLVRQEELPARTPVNGLDIGPLARYVAALDDPSRPLLETKWLTPNQLEVQGPFPEGMVASLQVSHADGWQAIQGQARIPIERDHLGFMVLHPHPEQNGRLLLRYSGEPEQRFCGWISLLTLVASVAAVVLEKLWGAEERKL
ncbi:MAG: hypothetical protein HY236_09820 [Acidobacteria bacterium]|nr:hypothetical protein [Acidobacteriota bacterium]